MPGRFDIEKNAFFCEGKGDSGEHGEGGVEIEIETKRSGERLCEKNRLAG
jgi:hypothetical protein